MLKFWRENKIAGILVTIVRFVVGFAWLDAGWHKITGATPFDATGFLNAAVNNPVLDKATGEAVYPTYTAFVEHFALPNVGFINVAIPWGEFLVGLGLILGTLTLTAAFFGALMNFMFMFAGTVSTNPWLLLLGLMVIFAGTNAGRFGLDRYVLPLMHKGLDRLFHRKPKNPTTDAGLLVK
ncbi:Crp/Fnr family transcriptional regulator [Paenibacillus sp. MY03]|jgi:thiosulfate dehydrogenase [quinone] large subunit|uniref:Crp/Fnr family transcriptional regulator n=1 Tax=Paenibacillus agaridevorans TaxID=171404 RepID=A0A2R5EQ75_9BACL|nr:MULTISPECIES: DoxX family membrane protein [Paenibacillus]OUS76185.1 Crp/Fnr family transcriptional regulator [Paenibacillus sp. MY03]GBG07148.1 Crp/Fnr family transcriptional regulator [Paenibacillus agaridevorans]